MDWRHRSPRWISTPGPECNDHQALSTLTEKRQLCRCVRGHRRAGSKSNSRTTLASPVREELKEPHRPAPSQEDSDLTVIKASSDEESGNPTVGPAAARGGGNMAVGVNIESTPFLQSKTTQGGEQGGVYILLLTAIAAIGGFLFGYDTGVVSGALLQIRKEFNLDEWSQELVVAITTVGAVVGALAGAPANNSMGRKPVILLSTVIFTVGAAVMGAAMDFTTLSVGRLIVGLAIGFSSMTIPVYLAETSPAAIRGRLVTLNCVFITMGQFTAGMVDGAFALVPHGWRYMLGLAALPAVVQFFGVLFLPESPRWLVANQRSEQAKAVLMRLRDTEDVSFELREIEQSVRHTSQLPRASWRDLWTVPTTRRAIILGCGLMILQQLAGINTVMYYSGSIYNMAGFNVETSTWLAGFTALAQFFGMVTNLSMVERLGRRTLVLWSLGTVFLSLIAIGLSFYMSAISSAPVVTADAACSYVPNSILGPLAVETCFRCVEVSGCGFCKSTSACLTGSQAGNAAGVCSVSEWNWSVCENPFGYMSVVSMVMYLFFFGIGMGPMPWTIAAEIFPLHTRSLANSITTGVNWIANVAVSATFLTLASPHVLTQYGAFWLYAVITLIGLIGLCFTLPETKGVPLEEIPALFARPGEDDFLSHYATPVDSRCLNGCDDNVGRAESYPPDTASGDL